MLKKELPVGLTSPVELLQNEADAMRVAIGGLDKSIAEAIVQKENLKTMAEAFDREVARLELLYPKGPEQLELELVS
jgi:hypothetical protein